MEAAWMLQKIDVTNKKKTQLSFFQYFLKTILKVYFKVGLKNSLWFLSKLICED